MLTSNFRRPNEEDHFRLNLKNNYYLLSLNSRRDAVQLA